MKTMQRGVVSAVAAVVLLGLGGCGGMTRQEQGTATGAVVGGVVGNVVGGGLLAKTLLDRRGDKRTVRAKGEREIARQAKRGAEEPPKV